MVGRGLRLVVVKMTLRSVRSRVIRLLLVILRVLTMWCQYSDNLLGD
jgi:hypothetical protein